jgi:hypothetical protein
MHGFDDYHALDADQINKLHYGTTKKLVTEMDEMKSRVALLEAQNAELVARLSTIEARIEA